MRSVFLVAVSFVSIVACAGPQDGASQYSDLTAFCAAWGKAECSTHVVTQCGAKDEKTCETERTSVCQKNVPQGTVYNAVAAPDCITAVTVAYQTGTVTADALDTMSTACAEVFSGPGVARAPCTVDLDCSTKDGLRCVTPTGTTTSKCLAPNIIASGGPCPGEADVCSDGYYCDPQSKVCKAQGAEGETCSTYYAPCQKGLKCPDSIFGATCQALKPAGVACTIATDCASSLCDKAVGQSEGVCADQVQLTALDSLCAGYN